MSKKETTVDITKDDFESLHKRLKELDNSWAETLVQMVNDEIEKDPVAYKGMEACSRIKVYNVFNGVVRNTKWKMLIYAQGLEFIKEKEQQISALRSQAQKIV